MAEQKLSGNREPDSDDETGAGPAENAADVTPIVGPVPEPRGDAGGRPWRPVDVNAFDNVVDGSSIEGTRGDYLFTVGNVSSGKSTLQSYLIWRLWTNPGVVFEYAATSGGPAHDAYLNGWVQNIGNGFFPVRTARGDIREFSVRFGQARRPMLDLGFIEIAGEDIRSIVPTGTERDREDSGLHGHLERYLRERGIRKRFLFVSDASANRPGAQRELAVYSEDILFNTLLRYLLGKNGIGLKRVEALFVAAKWDQVKTEYASEREYFKENFPQTLATVANTRRIRASFMPFSVGEVAIEPGGDGADPIARIVRKESKYIDTVISWLYRSFTQRQLKGHKRINRTLWDRTKGFFARLGG